MYRIYLINFGYYVQDNFASWPAVQTKANQIGFELRVEDARGDVIASRSPINGWTLHQHHHNSYGFDQYCSIDPWYVSVDDHIEWCPDEQHAQRVYRELTSLGISPKEPVRLADTKYAAHCNDVA